MSSASPSSLPPKLPRSITFTALDSASAVSRRKELMEKGKFEAAAAVVGFEDERPVKKVPIPETRRLEKNMLFNDEMIPSISLLRQHFVKEGRLTVDAALTLIRMAKDLFKPLPNLIEVNPPIIIVGDIHGQFYDLLTIFDIAGMPPGKKFVFLGDYVDRGDFSTEVVLFLCALKICYPENIVMLRGNHESRLLGEYMTFNLECQHKYSAEVFDEAELLFDALPLAAHVRGTAYGDCICMHGGIGPGLRKLSDINGFDRFSEIPSSGTFCDIVWSDPVEEYDSPTFQGVQYKKWEHIDYIPNTIRHSSYQYGPKAVKRFLKTNKLCCIIRAHQVQQEGYQEHFLVDESPIAPVLTIFSAPNYCDEYGNNGSFLIIYPDRFEIQQLRSVPHPYYLPDFNDAFTHTIPLILESVVDILQELVVQIKTDTSKDSEEEIKADKALEKKTKILYDRNKRLRAQQQEFRRVLDPTYHKNMDLFLEVLKKDAKNEAFPDVAVHKDVEMDIPESAKFKRCQSGFL